MVFVLLVVLAGVLYSAYQYYTVPQPGKHVPSGKKTAVDSATTAAPVMPEAPPVVVTSGGAGGSGGLGQTTIDLIVVAVVLVVVVFLVGSVRYFLGSSHSKRLVLQALDGARRMYEPARDGNLEAIIGGLAAEDGPWTQGYMTPADRRKVMRRAASVYYQTLNFTRNRAVHDGWVGRAEAYEDGRFNISGEGPNGPRPLSLARAADFRARAARVAVGSNDASLRIGATLNEIPVTVRAAQERNMDEDVARRGFFEGLRGEVNNRIDEFRDLIGYPRDETVEDQVVVQRVEREGSEDSL